MENKYSREVILDSSIWISYLDRDDSQHGKAVKLMQKIEDYFKENGCDSIWFQYFLQILTLTVSTKNWVLSTAKSACSKISNLLASRLF